MGRARWGEEVGGSSRVRGPWVTGTSVSSSIAWVSGTRNTDSSGFHSFSITQSPD